MQYQDLEQNSLYSNQNTFYFLQNKVKLTAYSIKPKNPQSNK